MIGKFSHAIAIGLICSFCLLGRHFLVSNQQSPIVFQTDDIQSENWQIHNGVYDSNIYIWFVKEGIDSYSPYPQGTYEHLVWENEYLSAIDSFVILYDPIRMEIVAFR